MPTFLKDDAIRLRAVEPGDSFFIWEIESDSSQWVDNGLCAPYSYHNIEEYAATYEADPFRAGQLRLLVEDILSKEIMGIVDLYDISPVNRNAFIGIYVLESFRCKGVASRTIALLETYCRQLLNLHALGSKVAEDNISSHKLFVKCGFDLAGKLPEWLICGHGKRALYIYTKLLS